ncbi:MAG TPA: hypothetical protein VIS94_09510 [Desulfomonilia bacterium]
MEKVYKIKNSLRIPMMIAIILSIPVFIDLFSKGIARQHIVIVSILVLVFIIFAFNNLLRKICIFDDRISIFSIAGKKIIPFNEITSVDGISLGRRQYISIVHKKKTTLVPNSFRDFQSILVSIKNIVPEDIIGQGLKDIESYPLSRTGDTIGAWITVIILAVILATRLG